MGLGLGLFIAGGEIMKLAKQVLVLAALSLAASSVISGAATPSALAGTHKTKAHMVEWQNDANKVLEQAKSSNKLLLADVFTSWCGPCKMMDRTTFKEASVNNYLNEHFVCAKVMADDNGVGQAWAEKNDVHAYPTTVIMNADGKLLGRIEGYQPADLYVAKIEKVLAQNKL
jgi:thiol:disulfide interchange protein